MKVVIAGGTGFIGRHLVNRYVKNGHDVTIISRKDDDTTPGEVVKWTDDLNLKRVLDHADLLINMSGKSVDCRYHDRNKREILRSRVDTTNKLNQIISALNNPPKLWINSSTATIYRHADDRPMTEEDGEIGTGFSVDVATKWEKTFFQGGNSSTRKVALRTAIVLGHGGGAYQHFKMLAKIGFGGPQGNGRQMVSFVHIEDVFRAIEFIRTSPTQFDIYNLSAPNPVTNSVFMRSFRQLLGVKYGLPIYSWMLTIGAFFLRTETELLLKSRWVLPERLESEGFTFKHPNITSAISQLISSKE